MSLSDGKQADIVGAFGAASRYLDDILNIYNVCFDNIVSRVYPSELQLDRAGALGAEVVFFDLFCQFLVVLFLPGYVMDVTTLVLGLSVSHFWVVVFSPLRPVESVSHGFLVLLVPLAMLLTSALAINC